MNLLPLSLAATAAYWALVTVVVGLGIAAATPRPTTTITKAQ
jgi:hypothetical protein